MDKRTVYISVPKDFSYIKNNKIIVFPLFHPKYLFFRHKVLRSTSNSELKIILFLKTSSFL